MDFLRHILRLCVVLLFSIFGPSMTIAVPMAASEINYSETKTSHFVQAADVGFAARAPPMAMSNVTVTGGVTVMHGGALALHEHEAVVASLGFAGYFLAPNRGFETSDLSVPQIRRNQIAGDRASDQIAARYPNSQREVVRQTSDGPRRIDVLTEGGGAIESKVGRTSADSSTIRQVNKDRELLENGDVASVAWEFRRSTQTGRVGPTPRLQAELEAAGIEIRIID